ncbi:MAG: ribonuclease P protein component [Nitrospirae bacterium]|nr:ribonuclease P protein component [Nitrospirota bacterium]MBI5695123.1 ribonuclease P protein component [Nitrospirota bacterium]
MGNEAGRITRRSDYVRVHKLGRKHVGRFLLLFHLAGGTSGLRVGITVSSKVGGAVVRNRAKRRIREAVRAELGDVGEGGQTVLCVSGEVALVALGRIRDASFDEIKADLASLLKRVA